MKTKTRMRTKDAQTISQILRANSIIKSNNQLNIEKMKSMIHEHLKELNTGVSKTLLKTGLFLLALTLSINTYGQSKETAAVLGIDTKGVIQDAQAMGYLVRLEFEKTKKYNVMDKYDIADIVEKEGIDISTCFGKSCLVDAGKKLKADKMLTGSVERFGEKIVITMRLIDVKTNTVTASDATEYLNLQPEIQKMVEISVKNLLGIENDPMLVKLLVEYDTPIATPKTTLKLSGPRMGVSMVTGLAAKRLAAPKNEGGYGLFPINVQFGYQLEQQYLSAGNFQALIEVIGLIGGLESGQFLPSISLLNGFRDNKTGLEFAFGPVLRLVQTADVYKAEHEGGDGAWHLEEDWNADTDNWIGGDENNVIENSNTVTELPDSRGKYGVSAGIVIAAGKTFRSGYLNIPVNFYVVPKKNATVYGLSIGFNISKKRKVQ